MTKQNLKQTLPHIELLFNEPLSKYTYTKTGGPADVLAFPKSEQDVIDILNACKTFDLPWQCLGNASNLIVKDGGIEGVVLMLTHMNQITINNSMITAEAGAKLIDTSYEALNATLSGLEFACGIPGSIGGAVYMNAGAYGGELSEVFYSANVLLPDGTLKTLYKEDLDFSYRHSIIQENGSIVLSATFTLQHGDREEMKQKMDELTHLRESKQPLEYPSCGSVFKRPEGHFTGQLIQEAGLQGYKIGGAQISEKHAGFIVNIDNATATDYISLIQFIQNKIQEQFDVNLETEVRIIGREKV